MAKIESVLLENVPESIKIGDNIQDISIKTRIEFNEIDLHLKMEYILYLYLYDVNVKRDTPILIPNWDETTINRFNRKNISDDFVFEKNVKISASDSNDRKLIKKVQMQLKLGQLGENASRFERTFNVFATLIPAIGPASKWSNTEESKLIH